MQTDTGSTGTISADRVESEAAGWLAALDARGLLDEGAGVEDLAAHDAGFAAWIGASLHHRIAFLRLLRAWQQANRLAALPGEAMPARKRLSRPALAALAACLVLAAGIAATAAFLPMPWSGVSQDAVVEAHYRTGVGLQEVAGFADGSRVELNTATELVTRDSASERHVELVSGEAYFDVARNEGLPFLVDAGEFRIAVLGTEFSVHRTEEGIELMVLEGQVRLESREGGEEAVSLVLEAGAVAITRDARSVLVERRPLDRLVRETAWREGQLYFSETRLADAAAEFNRYNHTRLVIADAATADIPVGGSFRAANVDGFARLLSDGMGLTVERRDGEILVSP